jgi:hypothetical protein
MEQHKRVLGIIYIVTAALQILILMFLSFMAQTILGFITDEISTEEARIVELVFSILRFIPWLVICFISIPSVIAGFGLLNGQRWALTLALILGCLKLLSFPIGTAIGAYSIWVYVEAGRLEKEQPK